ncbi:MAG: hypothetical protein R3C32_14875 [Chloroflexota bacterium]
MALLSACSALAAAACRARTCGGAARPSVGTITRVTRTEKAPLLVTSTGTTQRMPGRGVMVAAALSESAGRTFAPVHDGADGDVHRLAGLSAGQDPAGDEEARHRDDQGDAAAGQVAPADTRQREALGARPMGALPRRRLRSIG